VLSAIRADLERSPWICEGHRKVWARLRVLDGIRVARKRVLRLMRENGLLSPHRHLPGQDAGHDGRIITEAPNLMWGTDATQIPTVLDCKVWLFAVVDLCVPRTSSMANNVIHPGEKHFWRDHSAWVQAADKRARLIQRRTSFGSLSDGAAPKSPR
jgi:hypothetical protein